MHFALQPHFHSLNRVHLGTSVPFCEQFLLMTPLHYKHGEPMKPELRFNFDKRYDRFMWWLWKQRWYRNLKAFGLRYIWRLMQQQIGQEAYPECPWLNWCWAASNAEFSNGRSPWEMNWDRYFAF